MSKSQRPMLSVAEYVTQLLALSEKTQKQIAVELGYVNPNMISSIRLGTTKLPSDKIVPLAKALNVDPTYMMRVVMREYQPKLWAALEETIGGELNCSEEDLKLLKVIHDACDGHTPSMVVEGNLDRMRNAAAACYEVDRAIGAASVEAMMDLPKNSRKK